MLVPICPVEAPSYNNFRDYHDYKVSIPKFAKGNNFLFIF